MMGGMANNDGTIRLKVEGFDAEGRAVPMTGPMLVLLPFSVASHANLVRVHEQLPEGSLVVAVESEVVGAVPWSEIPDEVIVEEARRRWGSSLLPPQSAVVGREEDEQDVLEVFFAVQQVIENPPPRGVIRGWSPEERTQARTWALAWFEWAGTGGEGEEPKRPACLTRALDFLANGVIKLGGAT